MNISAMTRMIRIPILSSMLLLLVGCGGDGQDKPQGGDEGKNSAKKGMESDTVTREKGSLKKAPVLPSALQVASSFKRAGLPYKDGLTLSPEMVGDIVSPSRKRLVFGAYSADLAYLVLNKKGEQGLKVMNALMKLAEDLNLSSVFNTKKIAERFQRNIDQRDSLISLIVRVQERFDTYVAKNRSRRLRTIAYAGGWTEAMYLAAKSGVADNRELNLKVEEQMTVLDKLLTALERDIKNAEGSIAKLLTHLKAMERTYKKEAPEPGKKLPESLLKKLQDRAIKARKIISKTSS